MRNILFSKRSLRNLVSISHKSTLLFSLSTTSLGKCHFQAIKPILLINHSNFSNVTKPKSQRTKSKTSTISPPAPDINVLNSKAISKVKAEKPSQIIAREELLPLSSLDKKEKDSKIDYSTNPLTRYLIDKLGYKTSQLLNSYSYQGFFEISVDRFKRYRELLISNNLPEKLIVKYGYVFIIDNFKSFKKQVEMLVYLKERLEIEKENEIFDILETNGYFLLQTKEEIQKKIDIFLKEISIASIIDVKKSMIHRRRMWLKTSSHFQNILQLLQKEYHYTENELLAWFLYGKGKNLLSEKIFIDAAERKLIFEDLYGKDCFALKKSLRSTILSYPQLLSYPVSHYYSIINRFMEIFSLHDCTQMKWLPISIYNMGNIDRIEKRVELMYKYFTNGQELMKDNLNHHHHHNNNTTNHDDDAGDDEEQKSKKQKSPQLLYKVDPSRFEEKQRELDRLYPMKLTVTTPQDDEPSTVGEGVEDGNSNNNDLKKASSYNMNPIDEERLYQDYVASKTNKKRSTRTSTKQPQPQPQEQSEEQENIYDKFVQDSLREYSQQGMLEILTETQDYSSWQQHLEKKLSAVNLTMNDLYRELWKESEGIEMTSKETLTIIQSPSALSSHLSNPILKVGMMTVFLGLERNEAMRMLRIMK